MNAFAPAARDVGDWHYRTFRVIRFARMVGKIMKVIGWLLLGWLCVVAFICHEWERSARHRRH